MRPHASVAGGAGWRPLLLSVLIVAPFGASESYCSDKLSSCRDRASEQWCSADPQAGILCPVSCGLCGEGRKVNASACKDTDAHCAYWAMRGECETNPDAMRTRCPTSCSLCTPECASDQLLCKDLRQFGECDTNAQYMVSNCPVACGACRNVCKDTNSNCKGWAQLGECESNPAAVLKECPLSCGVCERYSEAQTYCIETNATWCLQQAGARETACRQPKLMKACPVACGLCSAVCMDHDERCPQRARAGECESERASMLRDCPASCGLCHALELVYNDEPCDDLPECADWARAGECRSNRAYMTAVCPIACGICYEPGHPNTHLAKQLKHEL